MDYDATDMPRVYDQGRCHRPEMLEAWMERVRGVAPDRVRGVLDLGCGTGRFTSALADAFPEADVVGLDPSAKMLAAARAKPIRARFEQAPAEQVELPDATMDVVFLSMVFHHFDDPRVVAAHCRRVLRSGGVALVRQGVADRAGDYLVVPWFPRARALMEARLPWRAEIAATFVGAGLVEVGRGQVVQTISDSLAAHAERVALRADSILVQLSDEAFARGLRAMRRDAVGREGPVTERIDWMAFRRE